MQQGTDQWLEARLGKATASRFGDITAVLRSGGEPASRRNYRAQLVVERLTGKPADHYKSPAMQWGNDVEEIARLAYSLKSGNEVEEVGFIEVSGIEAGASPDGLIGKNGLVEIKCRNTANHIEILKKGSMPNQYKAQVQGQMWVTEREWCDFVSYDPVMPPNAQLFITRVNRDKEYIESLCKEVKDFLTEVDQEIKFVREYK